MGLAAYKAGNWVDAHAAFLAAWSLAKHWQIAANLADCELRLGRFREAAEHASYYARSVPPDRRARAEKLLSTAKAKVALVTIDVNLPGAEVLIDDVPIGRSPLAEAVFVEPGKRRLSARLKGKPEASETVELVASSSHAVALKFAPEVVAPPIVPPKHTEEPITTPPKRSPVPAIVMGGLTAGAMVTGVAFVVASNNKEADALALDKTIALDTPQRCAGPAPLDGRCAELKSTAQDVDTFQQVAIGAFIGAGVLAAGAVTYLLWPTPKAKADGINLHAAPILGAGYGGITLNGAF